jgi:hypothetical protein
MANGMLISHKKQTSGLWLTAALFLSATRIKQAVCG